MTDTFYCESCGKQNRADAKFCAHCGVALTTAFSAAHASPPPPPPPPSPSPGAAGSPRPGPDHRPAGERVESLSPGATEVASRLAEQLRTPVVAAASISGAIAAAAVFGIGLLMAAVLPDNSLLGIADQGKGEIAAAFAQMLNFVQASYSDSVGKLGPALFVVFPIGACAVAARTQAFRTSGLSAGARLGSGAATGLVFGLLMLIPALATGTIGGGSAGYQNGPAPNVLSAVLLGIVWGAVGGLLGAYIAIRPELQAGSLPGPAGPLIGDVVRTIAAALRPLAVALAVMTAIAAIGWTVQTLREQSLREGSSTLVATVDNAAFAVEHGVHWTELGALVQFRAVGDGGSAASFPVPIDRGPVKTNSSGGYRIFGFNQALATYEFIPLLILVIGIPLLLALNAGFAVARLRGASTPLEAAAWGALVGPIWAVAMVVLNAVIAKEFFGRANGGSVLGMFLLAGAVVGAIGGLLVTQSPQRHAVAAAGLEGSAG